MDDFMQELVILATFVVCSYGAKLNKAYLPPKFAQTSGGSSEFLQTPLSSPASDLTRQGDSYKSISETNGYTSDGSRFVKENLRQINVLGDYERIERPRAALERNAAILRQINRNNGETYSYAFETENGIVVEEDGVASNGVEAQGGYSYTGDDGQVYSVRYTAGQNGFVPEGDHLPTPPPIPEILLALEKNARDEAAGIYDDGSYSEVKYMGGDSSYQSASFGHNGVDGDVIDTSNHDTVEVNSAVNQEQFQTTSGFAKGIGRTDEINNGVTKAYLPPTVQRLYGNREAFRTGYSY